jgi:membrane protease YdiL (CAAX protease family)
MNETRAVNGTGKMVSALIWLALIYAGEVAGVVVGMLLDADLDLCATLGGAIVAVLGIFMMKGGDYLRFDGAALFESWKFMWWIVAISAILMVLDLYDYVSAGEAVQQGWALRLLSSLVLCLAIGASEEGMFRGMLFGGLLARLGGKKNGILWAVAVSSLVFGCAHVTLDDFDPNNLLTFAQAGLKICQTGMYAVMLCAVVLKTKSLVGAMTVHAIDDWLLFVVSTGLYGETFETEYVTPDREEAIATIVFYLIICALYLPTFIKAVMELRAMQAPQFGPFVSEHEVLPVGQQPGYLPANQGVAMGVPGGWQQAPTQALPGQQGAYQQVPMQHVPAQHEPVLQAPTQFCPLLSSGLQQLFLQQHRKLYCSSLLL